MVFKLIPGSMTNIVPCYKHEYKFHFPSTFLIKYKIY
jgi:hypothetical protein